MNAQTVKSSASFRTPSRRGGFFLQALTALWLGCALALSFFLLIHFGFSIAYSGRIFPGVTMNGIPLSGLEIKEAALRISASYRYPDKGQILLTDGQNTWLAKPIELGFFLDPETSARAAFNAGRSGPLIDVLLDRFRLFRQGVDIQPVFIYNQNIGLNYLENLSRQINQPIREASLSLAGTEVVIQNGQPGRVLDIQASIAAITRQIERMQDGVVPLIVVEKYPSIVDASKTGELAREVLSRPLQLRLPPDLGAESGSWQIEPSALANLLSFEKVETSGTSELHLVVNQPLMASYLESIRDEIDIDPENARFIFNDETKVLDLHKPAVIGRDLDIEGSIESINQSIQNNTHSAILAINITDPAVTNEATGAELGITELVYAYSSYFRGSSSDRVQNIKTASERFHGLLIPPGATLSMSDVLGNISLDNGYAEALIILGDETIKGVGGGVCQVSTTLFRTAYYAGYKIVERHPHAYRVGYYEQTSGGRNEDLAGLDATVFVPLVDFKFTNDTPYWLLMETYVSSSNYSLTWKFYSTGDGRYVETHTTGLTNIKEAPDPLYRENPELPEGKIKQVDWAVDGADVTVTRTVIRGDEVLYTDRFVTHYQAWRDVYEYGPGTELPKE